MSVGDSAEVGMSRAALEKRGIPKHGLPIWESLPLWAKLPVPPAPKGAFVLTTTNLCEKIRAPSKDDQFDLTDPDTLQFSNEYQSLHDPHLKYHLGRPLMRLHLIKGGFITSRGKVLCTLREYNEYRKFLRRQQWQTQVLETRKQDDKQLTDINKRKKQYSGNGLMLNRAEKAKDVHKRLKAKLDQDKERYRRIMNEDEARREKIRNNRLERVEEMERKRREDDHKRRAMQVKKDEEDERRRFMVYAKWQSEDDKRYARMEERRRLKAYEDKKKLEKMWEERKRQQTMAIRAEQERCRAEEQRRVSRVKQHAQQMTLLQRQRQDKLIEKQEDARRERLMKQETYANKLQKTLRVQRSRKRAERMRSKREWSRRQSNWDWTKSLKRTMDRASSENDLQIKTGEEDIELERKYSASELGLFDLRGATFDDHVIDEGHGHREHHVTKSNERLSQLDIGDLRGANFKKRLYGRLHKDPTYKENVDKLLNYICSTYQGADMERIKRAIVDNVLEDKPSQTNVLGLEAGMFPEQGKVPDELSADLSGHVPILKQIAALQQEDVVGPKASHSSANIAVSPDYSEEDYRYHEYTSPPLDDENIITLSEVHDKVTHGVYTNVEKVANFLVQWTVNIAATIVHPAMHLGSDSDTTVDQHPSFLSSVFRPGRPSSSSSDEHPPPYKDTALHMSLLGIGDRHNVERNPRRSLDNDIGLRVPCSSDHGPMSRVNLRDSVVLHKKRSTRGPSYSGGGLNSLEALISSLADTLTQVRTGDLDQDRLQQLRQLATGILESAAILADGVSTFADDQERILNKRSSLLIEALVSDTLDQVMEDVKKDSSPIKTSSRLIADLINYSLNEAIDDAMNINTDRLAKVDNVLVEKFITNNIHDALQACRESKPTAEAMLLQSFVQSTVNKVVQDMADEKSSVKSNASDLACEIVESFVSIKDQEEEIPSKPTVSDAALQYVTTVLDHVIMSLRAGKISQKEAREMALKMGLVDEEDLVIDDDDIGSFVEAILVKTIDEIDAEMADEVVNRIISNATFLASEIGDRGAARILERWETGRTDSIHAVLMGEDRSSPESEAASIHTEPDTTRPVRTGSSDVNRFVRNVLSDVVIMNFVDAVLTGSSVDRNMGQFATVPNDSGSSIGATSISETVVNTFVKKILNSALEELPPTQSGSDSITQFVNSIIDKSHDFNSGVPTQGNIDRMADEITEHISALSLGKQTSQTGKASKTGKVTDSCPALVTPTPPTPPPGEPHDLTPSQHDLMGFTGSLHEHTHLSDTDESSEDELPEDYVEIHPVYKGEEVAIEHDHAVAALGAISVKRLPFGSHLMHNEAIHRNSFSSLTRPDLSSLRILQNKSLDQVKDKLEHVYQRSQMGIARKIETEEEIETLSDDEGEDNVEVESTESEAEYVLTTENLNDEKAASMPGIRVSMPDETEERVGNSVPVMKTNGDSQTKVKDKTVVKAGSRTSKKDVSASESRKSTKASSSGNLSKRKSETDRRQSKTSVSSSTSVSKTSSRSKRSNVNVASKKSSERGQSDVPTQPVKSIRSVDGTFSSKVEVRSTKSTSDDEQTNGNALASTGSQGIIMENEDDMDSEFF